MTRHAKKQKMLAFIEQFVSSGYAFYVLIESRLFPPSLRGAKRRGNPESQTQAFPWDSGLPRLRLAMTIEAGASIKTENGQDLY